MTSAERPRLLVLSSTYPRWKGDTEPGFVHELSRRLATTFDVTVLTPHTPGSRRREILDGVDVIRFRYAPERFQRLAYGGGILHNLRRRPWTWLLVLPFLVAMFLACRRELRRHPVAAVHAHWLLPQGLVAVLARSFGGQRANVVCTSHGGDLFAMNGKAAVALKRFVLRRADRTTVVSEVMRDMVHGIEPDADVHILPMGTDLESIFTPPPSPVERSGIVFVGRLVEKKGVRFLVEAFDLLRRNGYSGQLRIIGDGPERPALEAQVRRLGLEASVAFPGALSPLAVRDHLRRARFLVMPSVRAGGGDQEGFGLVQVEAMGCGCPVISSDLPAVRDVIRDGETGLLVPPGNPDALCSAMQRVLDSEPLGERLARTARAHALEHFDWKTIADRYRTLLSAPPRQARSPASRNRAR